MLRDKLHENIACTTWPLVVINAANGSEENLVWFPRTERNKRRPNRVDF